MVFVISSSVKAKNYPKDKYLNVINSLKENALLIWANEEELQDVKYIASNSKYATIVPKIDLNTLKALN